LIDCLAVGRGHLNPLGTPKQFADKYIADSRSAARQLVPENTDEFRGIVGTYMFRTRRIDAQLVFPDRQVQTYRVLATDAESQLQQRVADSIHSFNPLEQTSILVALMSSPQALSAQLTNMAAKRPELEGMAKEVHYLAQRTKVPAKAKIVLQIAANLQNRHKDWRMVVFTTRRETQAMLGRVLASQEIAHGFITGGDPHGNRRAIEAMRADPPGIHVIVSTDAGAEGVNLQAANILVNYDLPWNPMIVEQRIGRIQRIGSKFKNVWIANIVHQDSPEERIVVRLLEKLQVIAHTVGDIEAVLEASGDSEGESLEKHIRQMVIASLQGQDQEQVVRRAESSIEQARQLLEESHAEMESTLGDPRLAENYDVPTPELASIQPSMEVREFVLAARQAAGDRMESLHNGCYLATTPSGGNQWITFDPDRVPNGSSEAADHVPSPVLYQPGKPAFERLVQEWVGRSARRTHDLRMSEAAIAEVAQQWLAGLPQVSGCEQRLVDNQQVYEGTLHCRARVWNSLDSYEKILEVPVTVQAEIILRRDWDRLAEQVQPTVAGQVHSDPDISGFTQYYSERLEQELQRSDQGPRRERLLNDFQTACSAELTATEGSLLDVATVAVTYSIGDSPPFQSQLTISGGRIVDQPVRETCVLTGQELPSECLETCCVTGQRVRRDLLQTSEASGEVALPDRFELCQLSGKAIHQNEVGICQRTAQRVWRGLLVRSELSGRYVVPAHAAICEMTGTKVADDELGVSSLSAKRVRADQLVTLQSGGQAHTSEARRCEYSDRWYRPTDVVRSEVTGQLLGCDRERRSEKSNRRGDVSEMVSCQVTGRSLLVDETQRCVVSQLQVDLDCLERCSVSDQWAQSDLMDRCEVTKALVVPGVLRTCSVSGKRAIPAKMVQSDLSGRDLLRSQARKLPDGRIVAPAEVERCWWTGEYHAVQDTALCQRCGLRFARSLLNADGQFALLSECLHGARTGLEFPDPGFLARAMPQTFARVRRIQWITADSGKRHILFGQWSFFGFQRRVFAILATGNPPRLKLVGPAMIGRITAGRWVPVD